MTHIPVRHVMERKFALISYGASLQLAAHRLMHSRADAVVVQHDDGRLVGLLSERDLVFAAQAVAEGAPEWAGHYASPRFISVRESEDFDEVFERMSNAGVRRAVVVDDAGVPSGLFSLMAGQRPARREPTHTDSEVHA